MFLENLTEGIEVEESMEEIEVIFQHRKEIGYLEKVITIEDQIEKDNF